MYFWLSNRNLEGTKELLGFGLCLSLESFSYSMLSPYDINIAALTSNVIAFTTLLFLKVSLVKLLRLKVNDHIFISLYSSALLISIVFYFYDISSTVRVATLGFIFAIQYARLIYMLKKGSGLYYPKQILFINICLFISMLGNFTFTFVELLDLRGSVYFPSDVEIILVAFMTCSSLALVIGFITIVAEHREQSLIATSKTKSEFITNVSHEIRTPMNGVLGMLELLSFTKLDDEQQHQVTIAKSSANSLLTLINEVLDFSKIESGKLELDIIDVDIQKVLEETTESIAFQAHQKKIELILDTSELTQHILKTDPSKIAQILTNLLGNAIKFTQEGQILITAVLHESKSGNLMLTCKINDSGIGIPSNKLAGLFNSFTQVDSSTTRKFGGTGLGLNISKRLCELLSGNISVTSEEGVGSCFTFSIKVDKPNQSEDNIQTPALPNLKHLTILIADENSATLSLLAKTLNDLGASVLQAKTKTEIVAFFKKDKKIDIVLLNEYIEDLDILTLKKDLLKGSLDNKTIFVLMIYLGKPHSKNKISEAGFSYTLHKPLLSRPLYSVLNSIINHNITEPLTSTPDMVPIDDSTNAANIFSSKKILLVEDNRVNQMVAMGVLKKLGVGTIKVVNNGKEAIDHLLASPEHYNLILMDCLMPIMDGYEATQRIRSGETGEYYSHVPIVALTANAMKNDKDKCLSVGMIEVLTKPINTDKLADTLTRLCN